MNIVWIIIAGVAGFFIGRISQNFQGKSGRTLAELREKSREALDQRTKKRKKQILEMMRDFEVRQKVVERCNTKDFKKGIERRDVEKQLEVSKKTALKYLNELERENKVKQVGTVGQDVYYELKK